MNKLFVTITFILLNINFIFAQNQWEWVSPLPPYKAVYSSVVTGDIAYFWSEDNTVIKLDIPAENFEVLPIYASQENVGIGSFANQGIAFADSLIGYITDIAKGEFRTTNGGQNWYKTTNAGSNIHLIVFGSNLRGWKLGGGGFYITNSAGQSWSFIPVPFFAGYGTFSKMFALNENQLWVLKSFHSSGSEGSIWYSSNGGYNWIKINTSLVSDSLHQVSYYDLKINPSGIGIAIGSIYKPDENISEGFIQKTTDMGATWSIINFPNERYKNILLINDYEWVILGNEGSYNDRQVIQRKTTDMGNTWILSTPLQGLYNNSYFNNAVYTPGNDAIYMFATRGIYKSLDRGMSYSKLTSETDVLVSEIIFDSKPKNNDEQIAVAWLKGNQKPYLISFDAGYTWHQKSLPQGMGYIWLVGISEDVIYMIVNQTQLYKSTDYGDTWQILNIPVYSGLQALRVYSKDVFVLKAYKKLISSTDGGNTWIAGPTVENLWLNETEIIYPGTILGAGTFYDTSGTRGAFYRTTDFGFSWHIVDTDKKLYQISMLNDNIGYAMGDNKFYKTYNAGKSWEILLSETGYYRVYSAFAFVDSLNGILSSGNNFKITSNGGNSWSNKDLRIPLLGVNKLEYNAKGDLFAIGGGVMLRFPANPNNEPEISISTNVSNSQYSLYQNFPNPFNPTTIIKFTISSVETGYIPSPQTTLTVYDVLGNEIATLVNEKKPPGSYEVEFNAANLPSGVYFYQFRAGSFINTKKMILLK